MQRPPLEGRKPCERKETPKRPSRVESKTPEHLVAELVEVGPFKSRRRRVRQAEAPVTLADLEAIDAKRLVSKGYSW